MKIENTIQIASTPSHVWSVTEDVENWPEWTPTMRSVKRVDSGAFDVGSAAIIKQPGLPKNKWTVTALKSGEGFTWESRVFGIGMSATHELVPVETGTQNTLRIEMRGIVARLLWPVMRSSLRKALSQENSGLKARCEAQS